MDSQEFCRVNAKSKAYLRLVLEYWLKLSMEFSMKWTTVYDGQDSETYALLIPEGALYRHKVARSGGFSEGLVFVPGVSVLKTLEWSRVADGDNSETYAATVDGGTIYRHMIWASTIFVLNMVFAPKAKSRKKSKAKKPAAKAKAKAKKPAKKKSRK